MNILYINHYAGSPEMGMEFRPFYLSREWVKMGHNVTIIAGNYSHLRQINPDVEDDYQTEIIDGIEYVWIKSGIYQSNGVKRAFSMFRFVGKLWFNAKRIVKKYKPNVIIASSTYPLDTYPAQRIAKLSGAKYVHEVHDMWPSTLYEVGGMSKQHPFVVLMQIAEDSAYKHCNKCVSLPPYAKDYMVKHGLKEGKFVCIQNGIVPEEWENGDILPPQHMSFFKMNEGKFIVGYFGGHALSNSLDTLLDTAKLLLEKNDIIFVLVGNGVEKERLIKRAVNENIINVFFLDPVNKKCIPKLTEYFDCSIITGKPSPLYRFGLCMNKMFDSMMAGKPIICAVNSPNKTQIEEYSCGIQVNSAKPEDIRKAILQIYKEKETVRRVIGENGKKAVLEHFTYKKLAKKFIESIYNL